MGAQLRHEAFLEFPVLCTSFWNLLGVNLIVHCSLDINVYGEAIFVRSAA